MNVFLFMNFFPIYKLEANKEEEVATTKKMKKNFLTILYNFSLQHIIIINDDDEDW